MLCCAFGRSRQPFDHQLCQTQHMENRKKSLKKRPLLVLAIILLMLVTAGVWAWRHYPSAPEHPGDPKMDTLQKNRGR